MEGWLLFAFLVATAALALLAKHSGVAYPIVFVVAGALLGFIPNLPSVELQPNMIFLLVLPVVLFAGGWSTDLNDLRYNLRPIGLLAIGLVVFTTVMVAAIAHAVIPNTSWGAAFTLGAIVAPTDAIAAESIAESLAVQRRVITVISGESLLNDASALIVYRFAIAATLTGTFVAASVVPQFFVVSLGGIAVGLLVAAAITWLQRQLRDYDLGDAVLVNVILLFAPFAAYLPAEALGVSGVLATVACGIYLSRRSHIVTPDARLVANSTWEILLYLVNAFAFLLLGLQLHRIFESIGSETLVRVVWHGAIITVAVILLRFLWLYPATYLPRMFSRSLRERDPSPPWQAVFVIGWSGMRGVVSLAAALALPLAFPSRSAIVFDTFMVIFVTLVVMGLTLPTVIRMLGVHDDGKMEQKEIQIRIKALQSGLQRIRSLEPTFDSELAWQVEGRIIDEYEHRIQHLSGHLDGAPDGKTPRENALDHRLQKEALEAERETILAMRKRGEIPDEIYRHIQYDLDLADARLRNA